MAEALPEPRLWRLTICEDRPALGSSHVPLIRSLFYEAEPNPGLPAIQAEQRESERMEALRIGIFQCSVK